MKALSLLNTYLTSESYKDTAEALESHYELLPNSNIVAASSTLPPQSHFFCVRKFTEILGTVLLILRQSGNESNAED